MNTPLHNNARHDLNYYREVLAVLIAGVELRQRHGEIAEALNSVGIKSPTGNDWSAEAIKQCLKKFRHSSIYPSHMYKAMLQLVFDGELERKDVQCLIDNENIRGM